mgnify:CR=1 FL=1
MAAVGRGKRFAHTLVRSVGRSGRIAAERDERKRPSWEEWGSAMACRRVRTVSSRGKHCCSLGSCGERGRSGSCPAAVAMAALRIARRDSVRPLDASGVLRERSARFRLGRTPPLPANQLPPLPLRSRALKHDALQHRLRHGAGRRAPHRQRRRSVGGRRVGAEPHRKPRSRVDRLAWSKRARQLRDQLQRAL